MNNNNYKDIAQVGIDLLDRVTTTGIQEAVNLIAIIEFFNSIKSDKLIVEEKKDDDS